MIKKLLQWLLSFFQSKKEQEIRNEIEDIDDKLEEIEDEELTDDDRLNQLNDGL